MDFAYLPCSRHIFYTITLNRISLNLNNSNHDYLSNLLGLNLYTQVQACSIKNAEIETLSRGFVQNTQVIIRENKPGGDLCADAEFYASGFWKRSEPVFEYFFVINSSARGPFLPNYYLKEW
jgi:hypothetical protein